MSVNMQPDPNSYSINLPITFDYKGGRKENSKTKVIVTIILVVLTLFISVVLLINQELDLWQRVLYVIGVFVLAMLFERYVVLNEFYFSDVYENLLHTDFKLSSTSLWRIFDIDSDYPYIHYFKNGKKGIFVRMEKDAITGKPDSAMYDHYEAVGDAYQASHSLNMDIIHIDYMDNIGSDPRLDKKYSELSDIDNPDMQMMMADIYDHVQEEMSNNYASFDVYLFLSRDAKNTFMHNVQSVANIMIGGNFITYRIMDRDEVNAMNLPLFNLHTFSTIDACKEMMDGETIGGIVPISIKHSDGTIEELNKTQAQKEVEFAEKQRKLNDSKEEQLRKRHLERRLAREAKKAKKAGKTASSSSKSDTENDDLNLF